jgi:hypothetical protein
MPAGYMDAWLQVGKNYGDMIKSVGTSVAGGIGAHQEGQMAKESAPTMFSQYSQTAQAVGMQPDASIVERYSKLGDMSGPQAIQFNKDIMGAQQMQMNIANMQRQAQIYQMQQQAMQRAAQQQALQQRANYINQTVDSLPFPSGSMPVINPLFNY